MTGHAFKPIVYLKQNCPFCLKIRLFLLEAGLTDEVDVRDFAAGAPDEEAVRAELSPHLEKITFPAAHIEAGRYIAESEDILSALAARFGREPASLPVYRNYVEGSFAMAMKLWKENQELKAAFASA